MVEGHDSKATVVDLDGTLFSVNTLHLYIKTALKFHARAWRLRRVMMISMWCFLRYIRLVSHSAMKQKVLKWSGLSNDLLDEFRGHAFCHVNPKVMQMVKKGIREGVPTLLATAAADAYVYCLWDGDYIATRASGPELRDQEKLNETRRWLSDHNVEIGRVITDHYDDLPLARYADSAGAEVLLVNPSRLTHKRFADSGIRYEVI